MQEHTKPSYNELQRRLEAAEDVIEALQSNQVDAIVGKKAVALLRLQEVKEELRRSEEWRLLAMEAGEVGLWEFHPDTRRFYGSERTCDLFGANASAQQRIEKVWERIHPDDRPVIRELGEKALQPSDNPVFQIDFRILHPDGRQAWATSRGRTTFEETPDGMRPVCIRGAILDITDQKQAEAELHHLNRTLERRVSERTAEAERRAKQLQQLAREMSNTEERERQRIAAILHDDLQQLLAALRYRLRMLTSAGPLSEPQENHAEVLGQQIDECIEKARSLSHELSPPTLRHNGLVAALNWLAQDMKEKHGQTVVLEAEPNADPQSPILPHVLYRSVRELLFNSRKHSGENTARIAVGRDGDHLILRVADDGNGVDLSKLEEEREKTVGLGLFAIQERIQFLGGEVDIDTAAGRGFRVTIRIPDETPEEETGLSDNPVLVDEPRP